jgi:hypothetical protein
MLRHWLSGLLEGINMDDAQPPAFIYSYKGKTNQLWRTHLVTAQDACIRVPSYEFRVACCWNELPGGSLFITGGRATGSSWTVVSEVVKLDTPREFAVTQQPPMLVPRRAHVCVYDAQLLYVLGGYSGDEFLSECERYVCAENRWEALPPLPKACCSLSAVVLEGSLYALGGRCAFKPIDFIQKLRLDKLTWELLELKLPEKVCGVACFKVSESEVHIVVNSTLYSFTPLQVQPVKPLAEDIRSRFGGSYYYMCTLYCASDEGAARRLEITCLN